MQASIEICPCYTVCESKVQLTTAAPVICFPLELDEDQLFMIYLVSLHPIRGKPNERTVAYFTTMMKETAKGKFILSCHCHGTWEG